MKGYVSASADIQGEYRYGLYRAWEPTPHRRVLFIMLNPSTADGLKDDPTIRRCVAFAKAWGFGGMEIGNVCALRATDPSALEEHPDPVGPQNGYALDFMLRGCGTVVCAWGASGGYIAARAKASLVSQLRQRDRAYFHLGLTREGHPKHPLYLPRSVELQPWRELR